MKFKKQLEVRISCHLGIKFWLLSAETQNKR